MATDILVRLVRGANSSVAIIALLLLGACETASNEPVAYYDAAKVSIEAKKGITYANTTPVTGIVFSLNAAGDTLAILPYRNGKEHGWLRYYYDHRKPKAFRYYENGWKEGEHTGWFENGQTQFTYHFKDDMFEGTQKEWLASGQQYSELNYEKGMESGSQKVWYTNGKIRTNYIISNNRRYGLLGTKNCVNVVDSVFMR